MPTILHITAKCSDLCDSVLTKNGKILVEHDGYVPSIMPEGGGDYVDIEIDVATGKILNWVVPTEDQIKSFIAGSDEDEDEDEEKDTFDKAAFDREQGLSGPLANESTEIWLCQRCEAIEAESNPRTGKTLANSMCECCRTANITVFSH